MSYTTNISTEPNIGNDHTTDPAGKIYRPNESVKIEHDDSDELYVQDDFIEIDTHDVKDIFIANTYTMNQQEPGNNYHAESSIESVQQQEEWTKDNTIQLLEHFKKHAILWDLKNENFYNKILKSDAWQKIADSMSINAQKCRTKMISLLLLYKSEKEEERKKKINGLSKRYKSNWYAYRYMKFMDNRGNPRKRNNTLSPQDKPEATENSQDSNEQNADVKKKRKCDDEISSVNPELLNSNSEITSFISYLASKMNKYSDQTKNAIQHEFFDIIKKADNGDYDQR